jgi:hypothetical protein
MNNGKVADDISIRYQYGEGESRLEEGLESEEEGEFGQCEWRSCP